jgi:hypothetical protein
MTRFKCAPQLHLAAAAAAALVLATAPAHAATVWDEAVNGDLSNNYLAPSFAQLTAGSNVFGGSTGRAVAGGPVDTDYLHVNVPAGHVLNAMILLDGSAGIGGGAFLGLGAGATFPVPPSTGSAAGMLGWTIFAADNIGTDMLAAMATPSVGSSGFTIPLPAGDYTFWVQETSVGTATYRFELDVAVVPEAPTVLTMLGGLALLGAALKRRA